MKRALGFLAVLLYLAVWALVTPPLMAPEEA